MDHALSFLMAHLGTALPARRRKLSVPKMLENWPYDKKLDISLALENAKRSLGKSLDLWLLADGLRVPILQNEVMAELCLGWVTFKNKLDYGQLHRVYEKTKKGSPLWQFIADTWSEKTIRDEERYSKEMLVKLVNGPAELMRTGEIIKDRRETKLFEAKCKRRSYVDKGLEIFQLCPNLEKFPELERMNKI